MVKIVIKFSPYNTLHQGLLFCAQVPEVAIFAASKRCANDGFACMCKDIVHYDTPTVFGVW